MQRNFPNSRSRVHLAKLLAITVFQVREANRYSGLRSLHVVHGDEASAFIIALFPSKALHCREDESRGGPTLGLALFQAYSHFHQMRTISHVFHTLLT